MDDGFLDVVWMVDSSVLCGWWILQCCVDGGFLDVVWMIDSSVLCA